MKVLVVEPMKKCYTKEINGLEEMQALVGGYIQAIYPFPDKAAVVCNEEGKNLGLPFNRPLFDENDLPYDIICGTFFGGFRCRGLCFSDRGADPSVQGTL